MSDGLALFVSLLFVLIGVFNIIIGSPYIGCATVLFFGVSSLVMYRSCRRPENDDPVPICQDGRFKDMPAPKAFAERAFDNAMAKNSGRIWLWPSLGLFVVIVVVAVAGIASHLNG